MQESTSKTYRISKLAQEFNIGTTTIVDFLKTQKLVADANPNTKVDENIYGILAKEFQSQKSTKEASKKNLSQREKRETISIKAQDESNVMLNTEEEGSVSDILKKNQKQAEKNASPKAEVEKPQVFEEPLVEEKATTPVQAVEMKEDIALPEEAEHDMKTPRVVGRIDLSNIKDDRTIRKEKTAQRQADEKARVEASEKKAKEKEKLRKEKEQEQKNAVALERKTSQEKQVQAEKTQVVEAKPVVTESLPSDKKEAPIAPVSETISAKGQQHFTGTTVLGKIELPVASSNSRKPFDKNRPNNAKKVDIESYKKQEANRRTGAGTPNRTPAKPGTTTGTTTNQNTNNTGRPAFQRDGQRPNTTAQRGTTDTVKKEVTQQDVQREMRTTFNKLQGEKSRSAKYKKERRKVFNRKEEEASKQREVQSKILQVTEFVTVSEIASMMNVPVNRVIATLMTLGIFASINQRLSADVLSIISEEYGYSLDFVSANITQDEVQEEDTDENLQPRPPIVTVMGHVDHGKTSLLDYVRKANVIAGEAGGITQHIGAYSVQIDKNKKITFLDTPGHEAFTAMRARGAQVTDIAIIVIAADDSVMPQTKEAINHAQAAGVPMIFALNKMDKPGADAEKIRADLAQMNILVEDWGGKYQCQEISAKTGKNIDLLLEKVLLEAEMLQLKANPDKRAVGTIVESELDKGKGYVSTLLVQSGTMKVGDVILAGSIYGRIKAMYNERGGRLDIAPPSTPVSVLGLNGAPSAGETFKVMLEEKDAKEIASKRTQLLREQGLRTKKNITLDEIGRRIALGNFQELNIIVKGDVDGSIEALSDSLQKLSTEEIHVNIVHKGVGQITESDVLLASASKAIIIGFQVRPSAGARKLAENEEIEIRLYSIIYQAIEEIQSAMEGMLAPELKEEITGLAEIREVFKISKVGTVAGCYVLEGKISRDARLRLLRDGIVIYTGDIGQLKRFKDDVKEAATGYECGISFEKFNDLKEGDQIEAFKEVEVKRKLNQ
jgi:translation initiation factor IF-2